MGGAYMNKNILIMFENTPVMSFNLYECVYDVLREDLLPFALKGEIKRIPDFYEIKSKDDDKQRRFIINCNREAIILWLASRSLPLSRKYAKWIYNLLRIEQISSAEQKARISIICRSVSVLDNYWIKLDGDTATWESINVRHNPLNETIAQVALHGKSVKLQGSLTTPELTTNGAYAKAWRRHDDERLWLYKLGANGNTESRIEVMCSDLLDKMNVRHCHYEAGEDDGEYVCMCPSMTDDNISILPGMDFYTYCNVNNFDYYKKMMEIDADSIYKMWIVDYLLCNRDRHGQNWGFYYKPHSMEIVGCHPLFDHNNAFDKEWMQDRDAAYQFGDMTIREAAHKAMQNVDFHFIEEIKREDFITERQYNEFIYRAKELGIKTFCTYDDLIIKYMNKYNINLPIADVKSLLPDAELPEDLLEQAISCVSK